MVQVEGRNDVIDIDKLTVGEAREILGSLGGAKARAAAPFPFRPGESVLIRTVTMIQTGEIVGIGRDWIELKSAAWIADTGRFSDMLTKGTPSEVEPVPGDGRCVVGRGAIVDMFSWGHPLPRTQK